MDNKLQTSITTLVNALKNDPGYWISWEANIAMAFKDQYAIASDKSDIHTIANKAAKSFLTLLTRDINTVPDLPGALCLSEYNNMINDAIEMEL